MNAGVKYQYLWSDGVKIKTPIKVPAPEYTEYLMQWIEDQLNDESLFPTQLGMAFPKDFKEHCKNIFRRMFRVYAHLYCAHYHDLEKLGVEAQLNECFQHFAFFVIEFELIKRRELAPVESIMQKMTRHMSLPQRHVVF